MEDFKIIIGSFNGVTGKSVAKFQNILLKADLSFLCFTFIFGMGIGETIYNIKTFLNLNIFLEV